MNRRNFLKLLLALPFVGSITVKVVEWFESLFPVEEPAFDLAFLQELRDKVQPVIFPDCHVLVMHPSDIELLKQDPDWNEAPKGCVISGKQGFHQGFAIFERGEMT